MTTILILGNIQAPAVLKDIMPLLCDALERGISSMGSETPEMGFADAI